MLTAEGEYWVNWMRNITHTTRAQAFPVEYRDRVRLQTDELANYTIDITIHTHYAILQGINSQAQANANPQQSGA